MEHRLTEGNGDGTGASSLSSHIVEVAIFDPAQDSLGAISALVEKAYTRLVVRAEKEESLILAIQSSTTSNGAYVVVMITAQRVSRVEFERQQRLQQFGPGGARR